MNNTVIAGPGLPAIKQTPREPATFAPNDPNAPKRVLAEVSAATGIPVNALCGERRTRPVALARHVCCIVLRRNTRMSLSEIGVVMGHRDHTTVLNSCETEATLRKSRFYGLLIDHVERRVFDPAAPEPRVQPLPNTPPPDNEYSGHNEQAEEVILAVTKETGVDMDEMVGGCRHAEVVRARELAAYMIYRFTHMSYPGIGSALGTSHTTVMEAVRRCAALIRHHKPTRERFERLSAIFKSRGYVIRELDEELAAPRVKPRKGRKHANA